jgi:hypothetical protein
MQQWRPLIAVCSLKLSSPETGLSILGVVETIMVAGSDTDAPYFGTNMELESLVCRLWGCRISFKHREFMKEVLNGHQFYKTMTMIVGVIGV